MNFSFKSIPGSIVAPKGFLASGVFCDIKRLGTGKGSNKGRKRDLALIVSENPAVAAGMFTTNQVCAAPVKLCIDHLRSHAARALVINSGNANACTGPQGLRDAREMAATTARLLNISAEKVFVSSTGRIGVPLPMGHVRKGIEQAASELESTASAGGAAAEAIMTSDTKPKALAIELAIAGRRVRIGGICKGAGMIQPGMSASGARPAASPGLHATMLCFITTDAAIQKSALQACLKEAVAQSFNRITVDGDMSTNDTVLVLANGLAENKLLRSGGRDLEQFQEALNFVCLSLAKMIVRDGEGVSRFVTVRVSGARTARDADAAARAVANSTLVKTSWFGGDPNWGRILDALGYSAARLVEEKIDVAYSLPDAAGKLFSVRRGRPTETPFRDLCRIVAAKEFDLHIDLNVGKRQAVIYTCDLTEEYVDFNKGDVSDPASLGG